MAASLLGQKYIQQSRDLRLLKMFLNASLPPFDGKCPCKYQRKRMELPRLTIRKPTDSVEETRQRIGLFTVSFDIL